jgi:hypothetical protein
MLVSIPRRCATVTASIAHVDIAASWLCFSIAAFGTFTAASPAAQLLLSPPGRAPSLPLGQQLSSRWLSLLLLYHHFTAACSLLLLSPARFIAACTPVAQLLLSPAGRASSLPLAQKLNSRWLSLLLLYHRFTAACSLLLLSPTSNAAAAPRLQSTAAVSCKRCFFAAFGLVAQLLLPPAGIASAAPRLPLLRCLHHRLRPSSSTATVSY